MSWSVSIPRGVVMALDAGDAWPAWAPAVAPQRWLEATLAATRGAVGGVRRCAYRSVCQTASGGSFVVLLGGSFAPDDGDALRLRVALGDDALDGFGAWLATPMFDVACARLAEVERASGVLTLDRGVVHPVDTKVARNQRGAEVLCALLCDPRWRDEAGFRAAVEAMHVAG